MNIPEKIKLARQRKGLTQKQLAEFVGAAQATINKIEADNSKETSIKNTSFNLACKIADALDQNVFTLFGDSEIAGKGLIIQTNEDGQLIKNLISENEELKKQLENYKLLIELMKDKLNTQNS